MHRLSDIDPGARTATCEECGPLVRVRFRKHRNHWACLISEKRAKPEAKAAQRARARERRHRVFPVPGMTQQMYDALEAQQGGLCAICGRPEPVSGRSLAVDHCHKTGRLRGLLCGLCNRGLGLLGDDPDRLRRAADYLSA